MVWVNRVMRDFEQVCHAVEVICENNFEIVCRIKKKKCSRSSHRILISLFHRNDFIQYQLSELKIWQENNS